MKKFIPFIFCLFFAGNLYAEGNLCNIGYRYEAETEGGNECSSCDSDTYQPPLGGMGVGVERNLQLRSEHRRISNSVSELSTLGVHYVGLSC